MIKENLMKHEKAVNEIKFNIKLNEIVVEIEIIFWGFQLYVRFFYK
jgi:hypothetical protein